jgi:hypothetical protein
MNPIRPLSQILKEADSTKDLQKLIDLWNEIALNKKSYPLTEIYFANEHIRELALRSNGQDVQKGLFYYNLKVQCK